MQKLLGLFKRETIGNTSSSSKKETKGGDYRQNIVYVKEAEPAMKIAAVYRAVNLISSAVASLTLEYKRKDRIKGYFKLFDTGEGAEINYMLAIRPNERMNSFTFFKNMVAMILLHGNAYVVLLRDSRSNVGGMYLCAPGSVVYDVYSNRYTISDMINGIGGDFSEDDVIHLKNVCRDGGYSGLSTVHYAALTLSIAATASNETLKRFATGGRFKAVLQNANSVKGFGEYQDKQMQGQGEDLQDSINRGDDIFVMKGDGNLTPISMSSADMQFLENIKFTLREIARFFNMPPSKLMDDSNANYKSVEVSNIAFYAEALQPILTEIEREFSSKLIPRKSWLDYKFKFNLSSMYALDLDSKAKWDKARLDNGQATVNDIRIENDKPPVEKGDEVYLSVNLAPLGSEKLRGKIDTEDEIKEKDTEDKENNNV